MNAQRLAENQSELLIERLKVEAVQGNPEIAWTLSELALSQHGLTDGNRMVCHQLRGGIRVRQKRLPEALDELRQGERLAQSEPNSRAAFHISALLVECLAKLGHRADAEKLLETLRARFESTPQGNQRLDRRRTLLFAEAHYQRAMGDGLGSYRLLLEAHEICIQLEDHLMIGRCEREMAKVIRKHGLFRAATQPDPN